MGARAIPSKSSRPRLRTEGIADEAEIEEMRSRAAKHFAVAVDRRARCATTFHRRSLD